MKAFPKFMASTAGRILRIVTGIIIITIAFYAAEGFGQLVLLVIGLVPFIEGMFDYFSLAALFGMSISGPEIREDMS